MFGMALARPSLTMQSTSGVDVIAHVCGKKADTSGNYFDNIQSCDKRRFRFCQMWHNFYIVFWKLPQIRTSNFRKVVQQKNPCTTSYRSSIETIALNCLVFERIAFLYFGDKQTDRLTAKQMDKPIALSRGLINADNDWSDHLFTDWLTWYGLK